MAKKITLKNKNGDTLCPHTAIEQVQGLQDALDFQIDTRNLIPDSSSFIVTDVSGITNHAFTKILLPVGASVGDKFTFNCDSVINEAGEATEYTILLYNKDDKVYVSDEANITANDRVATLIVKNAVEKGKMRLYLYSGKKGETDYKSVRYTNCTLVKGDKPMLLWQEAPEDIRTDIDSKLGKNDPATTVIDGSISTAKIADAAITPAKIQTSIALNGTPSMTIEPTTSSPDKTIASVGLVKEVVDNVEIGGRNLIRNGDFSQGTEHWIKWGNRGTFSVIDKVATFLLDETYSTGMLQTSPILLESGQQYIASFDVRSDNITYLNYCYLISSSGNISLPNITGVTTEWQRLEYKFTATQTGDYSFGFGIHQTEEKSFQLRNVKIEKGNKATDWTPAPEDITAEITNAETRAKAHAEDYTNTEITKIENGETVAQKANSLYDSDSGTYKDWNEIDTAITSKIGDQFEDYATKSYVQDQIATQVTVPVASENEEGKIKLAKPEDMTEVENNESAVNDTAKAITPYTLKEYIAGKNFATDEAVSDAITTAKPTIFYQSAQPANGKDGDIWIIP